MTFDPDLRVWNLDSINVTTLEFKADEAYIKALLAQAIAATAKKLFYAAMFGIQYYDDSVEAQLLDTKYTIPAPRWVKLYTDIAPLNEQVVKEALSKAHFVSDNINVHINLRKLRFRNKYVYDITFSVVPSPELVDLCKRWDCATLSSEPDED